MRNELIDNRAAWVVALFSVIGSAAQSSTPMGDDTLPELCTLGEFLVGTIITENAAGAVK